MRTPSRNASTLSAMLDWLAGFAAFALSRSLQMPAPLVQDTGAYVLAQVQAFESEVGRSLCQISLLRRLRTLFNADR